MVGCCSRGVWLLLLISVAWCSAWTEVPPVKLLAVESVASRYPAAGNVQSGGYRTNIENRYEEDAHRGEIEKLNNFPELRMILNPSGFAYYTFPVASDQINMFVQPAAKQGKYHQDYCDKAPVSVTASAEGKEDVDFKCFTPGGVDPSGNPIAPCSSLPCLQDISQLLPQDPKATLNSSVKVKVCNTDS